MNTITSGLSSLFLAAVLFFGLTPQFVPLYVNAAATGGSAVNSGTSENTSANWAGYAATGGSYTQVSGTWTVPGVANNGTAAADVAWVGIGGVTSTDLIQAGTQATSDASGAVSYRAWYELLPRTSRLIPVAIRQGDSVSVSIARQTGGDWLIKFINNTTGDDYKTTVHYTSSLSSAEWIVEAPASNRGIVPLDDFGTVKFTDCSATRNGSAMALDKTGAKAITMINGNRQALATVSALIGNDGFSVTRTDAASGYSVYFYSHRGFRNYNSAPRSFHHWHGEFRFGL